MSLEFTHTDAKTGGVELREARVAALAALSPVDDSLTKLADMRAHEKKVAALMTDIRADLDAGKYKADKTLTDQLARHLMEESIAGKNVYDPGKSAGKATARNILSAHAPALGLASLADMAEQYNKNDDRLAVAMSMREATSLVQSNDRAARDPVVLERFDTFTRRNAGITNAFKSFVSGASLKDAFDDTRLYKTPAYEAYARECGGMSEKNKRRSYRSAHLKNSARASTAFREFRSAFKTAASHLLKEQVSLPLNARRAGALNTPLP